VAPLITQLTDSAASVDEDVQVAMAISLSEAEAAAADLEACENMKQAHNDGTAATTQTFDELFTEVVETAPLEAQRLAAGVSDRALRSELAEIVVKRAFSECPNLSLVVNGLLTRPL
jgi:hypothetical protein